MKNLFTACLVFVWIATIGQTVTNKTISINPYLSFENYEHFKRLILSSPNSSIAFLDDFEFAWGYTYQLSVKETDLVVPLSDGTRFEYTLDSIVAKTKVPEGTQFKLLIDPARYYNNSEAIDPAINATLKPLNDSTYLYFNKVYIEVPEALRLKFKQIIDNNAPKMGKFIFIDDKRIGLVALQ